MNRRMATVILGWLAFFPPACSKPPEEPSKPPEASVTAAIPSPPSARGERDIHIPRVPADQLAAAKALKPPFAVTAANLAKGKEIFLGKGTCFTCHGTQGKGDGIVGQALNPSPRNFTDPEFARIRTAGEMFWVVKNGSPGTGMIGLVPGTITEDEGWLAVLYERSLGGAKD